jgi:hypothetical protein
MSEERNQRDLFEGKMQRGPERRVAYRRKADYFYAFLKYLAVALLAALMVKYLG